jgi:hypothetical protein
VVELMFQIVGVGFEDGRLNFFDFLCCFRYLEA